MANSQKDLKMNGNEQNGDFPSLEEIESILKQILPREIIPEIIKVLPMYPKAKQGQFISA